jgi:hypothetical protein
LGFFDDVGDCLGDALEVANRCEDEGGDGEPACRRGTPRKIAVTWAFVVEEFFSILSSDSYIAGSQGHPRSSKSDEWHLTSRHMKSWHSRPPSGCPGAPDQAAARDRVRGTRVNRLIVDSLAVEIEWVRAAGSLSRSRSFLGPCP